MAYGQVIKMQDWAYKMPNRGTLIDLETGIRYEFLRPSLTGKVTEWNVKVNDIVSFTISGSTATEVTLYKKHIDGTVYSYSSGS